MLRLTGMVRQEPRARHPRSSWCSLLYVTRIMGRVNGVMEQMYIFTQHLILLADGLYENPLVSNKSRTFERLLYCTTKYILCYRPSVFVERHSA